MIFIYKLCLKLYYFSILIASTFNHKARLWIKGRRKIFEVINSTLKRNEERVWFHVSSLGEFEQGRFLIEQFKIKYPQFKIVLTFFSPSGYEIRKNYPQADYVFYLPLDTENNAKEFVGLINPKLAFFIKYEFWYFYILELKNKSIPLYVVSAIFRPKQIFFRWYGGFFRRLLKNITHIFIQNEISENLLKELGVDHITISGDTRFDRVYELSKNPAENILIEKFKQGKKIFIAGSTWSADEKVLVEFINHTKLDTKFIIAPHEIDKNRIQKLVGLFDKKVLLYSQLQKNHDLDFDILIIDNIGLLFSLYKYCEFAYIGGGFGKGIHNILEAATFGIPILFGPNYQKFQEAKDLILKEGAFTIRNNKELIRTVENLYSDSSRLQEIAINNKKYIENKKGATRIILDKINHSLTGITAFISTSSPGSASTVTDV